MATNYKDQGYRARRNGDARDSCRFKAADIRAKWLAGWDERDAEAEAERKRAAVPRWETRRDREMELVGDAPRITVHQHIDRPSAWLVSAHEFGIDSAFVVRVADIDDPAAIQALAVRTVRRILAERMAKIDAVANANGYLLPRV